MYENEFFFNKDYIKLKYKRNSRSGYSEMIYVYIYNDKTIEDKLIHSGYRQKYLKYKAKYLKLKKLLEK
jgi:hypothetical protein